MKWANRKVKDATISFQALLLFQAYNMSTFSHSITVNDTTVTVSFPTILPSNNLACNLTVATPTPTPTPTPITSSNNTDLEYNLFLLAAKRMGCDYVISHPEQQFDNYVWTVKKGCITGSPAQKIEFYLSYWGGVDDSYNRTARMKELFAKNKLTFTPDVMPLYDEWQKTYTHTGIPNLYKKMYAFIDVHRALFTA